VYFTCGEFRQGSKSCSVNEELAEYITRSGLKITGPMYNRYIVGPGKTDDPAQYLTEICIPVA